jgi:hypothetical protein
MATLLRGSEEFLRVFGAPAHIAASTRSDAFEGWCDEWPEHAVYLDAAAATTLSHFGEGFGETEDGEHIVCAALEADGALLTLHR